MIIFYRKFLDRLSFGFLESIRNLRIFLDFLQQFFFLYFQGQVHLVVKSNFSSVFFKQIEWVCLIDSIFPLLVKDVLRKVLHKNGIIQNSFLPFFVKWTFSYGLLHNWPVELLFLLKSGHSILFSDLFEDYLLVWILK